jgi:hypothetical protein
MSLETPKVGTVLGLITVELGNKRLSHVYLITYNYSSLQMAVKYTLINARYVVVTKSWTL